MFYEDRFVPTIDNDVSTVDLRNQKKRSTNEAKTLDNKYEKYTFLISILFAFLSTSKENALSFSLAAVAFSVIIGFLIIPCITLNLIFLQFVQLNY